MKQILLSLSLILLSLTLAAQTPLKKIYNEEINPNEQIDHAITQAQNSGKFVVCQVGGNWCPWCLIFADFAANDTLVRQMIEDNFILIHVNYNPRQHDDKAKAQQAETMLKRLQNPTRFGFPVFVILDDKGNVIHIQDSSFLEQDKGYNRDKVLRFFRNWTPKAVKSKP